MKRGFTLIELLVVVLIIGILTAIALPKYEKTVEKAKVMKMLPLYRHVIQAIHEYDMATGRSMPPNFDTLGPILPGDWTGTDTSIATSGNGEWSLELYTGNAWRFLKLRHEMGTYTGGAFIYVFRDSILQHNKFPTRLTIVCSEATDMSTGQGGFCQKIFGGQYIGGNGDYLYTFPY